MTFGATHMSKMAGGAQGARTEPPAAVTMPLTVGTLNISGVQKKKTDLLLLLEETQCDCLGLQETLLRASDWQLRVPGYHCFTAMGDMTVSQRGVALLVSTRFNCTPVGKATPFWTFARVYGTTLTHPMIVGSVYVPCQTSRQLVLQGLSRALAGLHREYGEDPIILVGDFNMKLAPLQLETATWELPMRVLPIEGDSATRWAQQDTASSAIDFILYFGTSMTEGIEPAKVFDSWDLSDHFPVIGKLPGLTCPPDCGASPPLPASVCTRIEVEKKELKQSIESYNYWEPLAEAFSDIGEAEDEQLLDGPDHLLPDQQRLDFMAQRFTETCHQIATDAGLHQRMSGLNPPRVKANIKRAINARRRAFQALMRAETDANCPTEDLEECKRQYSAAQSKAKKTTRLTGRKVWHKNISQAHVNMRDKPRLFWKWASATAGWRKKSGTAGIQPVYDTNGRLLTALADIHRAWGEHYGRLAADETGHSQDEEHWSFLDPQPQTAPLNGLNQDFTQEEVWSALTKMKSHRAPGGDGVPTELLKGCLGERPKFNADPESPPPETPMTDSLMHLANFAFQKGLVAESWAESIVVSVPKQGDLADVTNYRGISLMATVLKVIMVMLSDRVNLVAEERGLFSRAQAGFRRKEECVTQAAMVIEVIQQRRLVGEPTYAVFIDLKKAYGLVPHQALFAKLSRFGIRGKCLAFIKELYRTSTIRVRVGGGSQALYSDPYSLKRGVRQG